MNGQYGYTPQIWPSALTVLLLITLSIYSWSRRGVPGALPFMIGCLFAALWAAGSVMEYAAVDVATKVFWAKFQSVWQLPLITAIFCFVLEYAWPGRWLTRRNLTLLSIPSFLVLGLILTNDLHHLTWQGFEFDGSILPRLGPGGWIFFSYAYAVILANIVVLAWLFIRSPYHRWPVIVMLIGQFGGRTIFLLEKFQILHAILPIEVMGMGFEFLMYAVALFGFRIFDPIPMARQTVITQMRDGMLALDALGRVVSLNPAAERIFRLTSKQIMGKPARELLPAYPDGHLTDRSGTEIEFSREVGQEVRHYTLTISPLKDWRELEIGRLLLLHDVTAQKRAQVQLLEQQKMVASLHEREQLARELHDSLGQALGYLSMQAQAIRKRARDGDTDSLEGQLTQLAEVAQEAHKDIRESIFNLKTGPVEGWSFFATLRGYLAGYQEHYGIRAELDIAEELTEDLFETSATVQLLRVIQEALTNTRKHGRASRVQVSFAREGNRARIVIADDGRGFDLTPSAPPSLIGKGEGGIGHFGLAFMRERMELIGGSLAIKTQPGAGTRVSLLAPIRERQKDAIR